MRERATLLAKYLRTQRKQVLGLSVLLLASIALQLVNPQILRRFIDTASAGGAVETLVATGAVFMVVAFVQQGFAVGAVYLSENVGWVATNALRADLMLHCLRLDQSFHKSRTPGELIERIDGDATALANFFSQFVIKLLGNALLLVGVLVVLWGLDWRVGLVMTVVMSLALVSLTLVQAWVVPYWRRARQSSAELFGFVEERLAGTEDIRANGAQEYVQRRLFERMRDYYRTHRAASLRARATWSTAHGFYALGTASVFAIGAWLFRGGSLTVGTIFVVAYYLTLLVQPLLEIARQAEDLQKAGAGIARIQELFAFRSVLDERPTTTLPRGPLAVTFDKVAFSYDDEAVGRQQKAVGSSHSNGDALPAADHRLPNEDALVLRDVVFALQPSRVLGVLGRTGSGKTTLTRLLFRLYDPRYGAIRLGDADIRDVALRDLRRRVGIVTQEVQIFHATLRANLSFFDRSIPDAAIVGALDDVGLGDWFRALPAGLDTVLAAGHGGLSAGEAQLLAFTRIFLRDPGVVILDEASSRVDPATEQLIEHAVDKLLRNRTGIIIAHRLATIQRADDILILEGGHVREYGPRATLIADPQSRFNALLRTGMQEVLQ
jgi:ATP-binding cassette subfamily B protein